ncbi:MAG TPA: M56 family metallopeptidase [Planctomycetota bacterium]|nr:M56 family metallopeptidase [Planctomycetota bacterium]
MGAEPFALALVAYLLTYALHSTLLISAAWLVSRRLGEARARLCERIWKVALVGGLASAALQLGCGFQPPLGRWILRSEPHAAAPAVPGPAPAERAAPAKLPKVTPVVAPPFGGAPLWVDASLAHEQTLRVPGGARRSARAKSARGSPSAAVLAPEAMARAGHEDSGLGEARPATRWPALAAALWIAGGIAGFLLFARGFLNLGRALRGRRELGEGPLFEALERLRERAAFRRPVRVWVVPQLSSPVSFAFPRPQICVPPRALDELSAAEQEAMLAHELAHLARGDSLWLAAGWLLERVLFFQPLNRVARRELEELFEILCDDWAVRQTGRELPLASCLARVATWIVGERRPLPVPQMAHGMSGARSRSRLARRVERLLEERRAEAERPCRWVAALSAALLAVLALAGPGVSVAGAQREPSPEVEREAPAPAHDAPEWVEPERDEPQRRALELCAEAPPEPRAALARELAELDLALGLLLEEIEALHDDLAGLEEAPDLRRALRSLELRALELAARRTEAWARIDSLSPRGASAAGSAPAEAPTPKEKR